MAITRARVGCIIVGDGATLRGAKDEERVGLWGRVLDACEEVVIERWMWIRK